MSPGKDKVSSTKTHWWARWKLPTPMCTLTVAEKINHKSRKRTAAGVVNKSKKGDLRLTSSHSATSKSLLPEIYPNFSLPSNLWCWMVLGYSYPKKAFTTKHEKFIPLPSNNARFHLFSIIFGTCHVLAEPKLTASQVRVFFWPSLT